MPEIVLKCVRVVTRRREAAALGPRVTVLVLAGAMSRYQQGRAGLQTFIWLSKIETVFDGGGE